ncbi:MAG: hypothetical protein M3416_00490 [Acidobacteriota bacterium]|nr:hypothetical protein [Acidobacteriota bacterium]
MRATRRRPRTPDPLASPAAVRAVCDLLRERLPDSIPRSEKHLIRFLYAVRHVERRPATDTRRGRPARWPRETLTEAAGQLRGILQRETRGRVSVSSFIGQYLQVLYFPPDVVDPLASGQINLQEAAQLARLTPERLNCSAQGARARRAELLEQHLAVQGSQTRLRARVKELLGEASAAGVSSEGMAAVVAKVDELLEVDPTDARHMFWEEMRRLFFSMKEIEPEDLDEETMDDFLRAVDQVSNVLYRIEKRRRERRRLTAKLAT